MFFLIPYDGSMFREDIEVIVGIVNSILLEDRYVLEKAMVQATYERYLLHKVIVIDDYMQIMNLVELEYGELYGLVQAMVKPYIFGEWEVQDIGLQDSSFIRLTIMPMRERHVQGYKRYHANQYGKIYSGFVQPLLDRVLRPAVHSRD